MLKQDIIRMCEIQADIFSNSIENFTCGSKLFVFRFMSSKLAKLLDDPNFLSLYTPMNYKDMLLKEYPGLNQKYGYKINEPIMHWVGYIYRAISLSLDISSKKLVKQLEFADLVFLYSVYHTFGIEYCVNRIAKEYNLKVIDDERNKELARNIYKDTLLALK